MVNATNKTQASELFDAYRALVSEAEKPEHDNMCDELIFQWMNENAEEFFEKYANK